MKKYDINRGQLKNPDISGALNKLRIQYQYTDVRVL